MTVMVKVRINVPDDTEIHGITGVCNDWSIVSGEVNFNDIPPNSFVEIQPNDGTDLFSIERKYLVKL